MPLQCSTQWDGLGHIFDHGKAWNGRDAARTVTSDGDLVTGIEQLARPVCGRGVLLDAGRVVGPSLGTADGARGELPDETRQEVARRRLHHGLRMVASNAETGVGQPVVARPAPGGIILSGTKSFNTNSGGRGLANVGCTLEGSPGRHHVLVELTHPDVELHDDWDNMGQRGTDSQTITYRAIFVADGWHYPAHPPSPCCSVTATWRP
jgi:alkylation response protein AidB-like acyl-CoA dehydrogenase